MANIRISTRVINSAAERIKKKLDPTALKALFESDLGPSMVAQVRKNVVRDGAPSGSMAKLSGFNQARVVGAKERIRQRKVGLLDDGEMAKDKGALKRKGSRHTGYARQKELDHERGEIPYTAAERWRRTGRLVENLIAVVQTTATGIVMWLDAQGSSEDGTPYSDVLKYLCRGTPRMPARDPTQDMTTFEKRVEDKLRKQAG